MANYRIKKVHSKIEMIDVLRSLLGQNQNSCSFEQIQKEWESINKRISELLHGKGTNGWDFNLMDYPQNIPLFNISINKAVLLTVISINDVVDLLAQLELPWCVRIEHLDRIRENLMVGGNDLQDAVVTKDEVYLWQSA